MTKAVIYTRFSPRRNAGDCESCETQEQLCRDFAELEGWDVKSVHHDEGVSGKEVHREGLEAALAELGKGDVLLVYRRDRLARDPYLAELIRRRVAKNGATIAATQGEVAGANDDTPEARFIRHVLDGVAQLERELIAARTKAALLAKQRAGQRVSRYAPYGYKLGRGDKLVPVKQELEAVQRIKTLAKEGVTIYGIKKAMDEEYPGACRGKSWSKRTIQKIVDRR